MDIVIPLESIPADGIDTAGTSITSADVAKVPNDGRSVLFITNAGVQATVTLVTSKTVGSEKLAVADPTITIPATTGRRFISKLAVDTYGSTIDVTTDQTVLMSMLKA